MSASPLFFLPHAPEAAAAGRSPRDARAAKFLLTGSVGGLEVHRPRGGRAISATRRYSDEEFAIVLRKAAELQDGAGGGAASRDGLTLEEMKAIARDVGIDPRAVERAALSLSSPPSPHPVLGGPTRLILEGTVAGKLSPEAHPRIVDAIRHATGYHGAVELELGSLAWKSIGELSQLHVVVRPEEDHARVQVSADRSAAFILTWFGAVAGGMVGAGITGAILEPTTLLGGFSLFLGMAGAGLLTARTLWTRGSRRFKARLDALFETVRSQVAASSEEARPASE